MTMYSQSIGGTNHNFDGLIDLLAKATPRRSGDELAGCAAASDGERAAAQWAWKGVLVRMSALAGRERSVGRPPHQDGGIERTVRL